MDKRVSGIDNRMHVCGSGCHVSFYSKYLDTVLEFVLLGHKRHYPNMLVDAGSKVIHFGIRRLCPELANLGATSVSYNCLYGESFAYAT